MTARSFVVTVGLALAAFAASPSAQTVRKNPPADVTPIVERSGVPAGSTERVAIEITLPEGLHAQSNKPLKPNIPTTVTVTPPPGVTATEIVFPPTHDIRLPGYDAPLPVFEREFTVGLQLAIDGSASPSDISVPIKVRYQACNDVQCFLPISVNSAVAFRVLDKAAPLPPPERADLFAGIAFGTGEKPAPPSEAPAAGGIAAGSRDGFDLLNGFTVQGSPAGGYLNKTTFLQFLQDAEADVKSKSIFENRGPLAILVLVFIGGLALNLTPCVLPMIPINIAIIGAGTQAGRKSRGLLLGAVYGSAMAVVYGVLGLVVILTAGTFGAINASPWFNAAIAILFVVLGLAMFDIGVIDLSRFSSGIRFKSEDRGSLLLAFSMGAVAALLAGACVAPVVIQVVFFASNLYAG